jgi:hypothetical protein
MARLLVLRRIVARRLGLASGLALAVRPALSDLAAHGDAARLPKSIVIKN